jgi:hypothetical protein
MREQVYRVSVIPITERDDDFLVVWKGAGNRWVFDDQGSYETINIL